jgi:hypothetical protein
VIRVGLELPAAGSTEPVGAWALDLLGCHAPGRDEADAVAALPAAIERYLGYARDLGASAPGGEARVVETFRCRWVERYEVNALFEDDLTPTSVDEVTFATRMLEHTRRALLEAAAAASRPRRGERAADQVLHHVASAEWFYASRSEDDPERLRSEGASHELDPRKRLALVRQWTVRRLANLPALGQQRFEHQGETWTARKILRRSVYHDLDHVRELRGRASRVVE